MRTILHLVSVDTGYKAFAALWPKIKVQLLDGNRLELEVRPERRSTEANALLHAILSEISAQKEWAGAKRSVEVWKRLLTAAWLRARGESVEILPALDGHGIDVVFRRTSELNKHEFGELVEFISAWAVENGIEMAETA